MPDNRDSCENLATGGRACRRSGGTTARSRSRTAQRRGTGQTHTPSAATGNQGKEDAGIERIAPRESSANHASVNFFKLGDTALFVDLRPRSE